MDEVCLLCNTSVDDPINYGQLKRARRIYAHYFCVLMSTSITQSGKDHQGILGFLDRDIKIVVEKCKSRKCHYCGEKGATINCFNRKCKRKFHFPCGLKNNCSFNFGGRYETFCHRHNHYPKIPGDIVSNMQNMECVACLDDITDTERVTNLMATPCCRLHLLHIRCAKYLAQNGGYFTKCPICSNTEEFTNGLRNHGIFVPLQDASWEQQRGAYSELTCIELSCDIDDCTCPEGRYYDSDEGPWELLPCNDCGSSAAHLKCSKLDPYLCDICVAVSRKMATAREIEQQAKRIKLDPYVNLNQMQDVDMNSEDVGCRDNIVDQNRHNGEATISNFIAKVAPVDYFNVFNEATPAIVSNVQIPQNCEIYLCNSPKTGLNVFDVNIIDVLQNCTTGVQVAKCFIREEIVPQLERQDFSILILVKTILSTDPTSMISVTMDLLKNKQS